MLHIRFQICYGSDLVLRDLRWLVNLQLAGKPLLRRYLPKAFVLDYRKVLYAAIDRRGGTVSVSTFVANEVDSSPGRVGPILLGVLHADGGSEETDFSDEEKEWTDLGAKDERMKEKVLKTKLREAKHNGISAAESQALKALLPRIGNTINLILDASQPPPSGCSVSS